MDRRRNLDNELRQILQDTLGYVNLYFQPPASVTMKYDCIRYSRSTAMVRRADDRTWNMRDCYELIVISRDPESPLPRIIQNHFQMCQPDRYYTADNLYHYTFTLYY